MPDLPDVVVVVVIKEGVELIDPGPVWTVGVGTKTDGDNVDKPLATDDASWYMVGVGGGARWVVGRGETS